MPKIDSKAAPATVKMVRPEDMQPKPCVADVPEEKVQEWRAEGWVVKTDAEIEEMIRQRAPVVQAEAPVQAAVATTSGAEA